MEKMKMSTNDIQRSLLTELIHRFPEAFKEETVVDENGKETIQIVIDSEYLNQNLSLKVISGEKERYQINWPGKKKAIIAANLKTTKTLRPAIEESVDFDNTKNIYIEGDNLEVLKLLRETYLNKIDLIYIDPPYNAGADLLYKNNYEMTEEEFKRANFDMDEEGYIMTLNSESCGRFHTDWLNMMYSRIKVARDMLSDEGCMVLAIDHNELANLIKICDELFGEFNRLGIVTVVHKPEGRNMEKFFATSNEFALFYAKNKASYSFQPAILDDDVKATYNLKDSKGYYRLNNYVRLGGGDHNLRVNKPHFWYPIYVKSDLSDITLVEKEGYEAVYPYSSSGQERTWKTKKETTEGVIKSGEMVAVRDDNGKIVVCEKYREGQLIKTHWINKKYNAINGGTKILEEIMECKTFDFPKSLFLMEDIIKITTKKDSIVLDFFSGSSTTAHAVMSVNAQDNGNRKFIMIQLPWKCDEKSDAYKAGYKTIPDIAKERIRRSGKMLTQGLLNSDLDVGFRVFKLDSSNMTDVYYSPNETTQSLLDDLINNVKEDRTSLDLLFQCMLELGIPLSSDIHIDKSNESVYSVNDNQLVVCFDSNVTESIIKFVAEKKPQYAIFKDSSFATDSDNINCEQIFKSISPSTVVKVI